MRMRTCEGGGPEVMRVWMLSGFRISIGARTLGENTWQLRKAAAIVKLLALSPGQRLHRERVMDLLWTHLGIQEAANSLRRTLHAARRALDPDPASTHRYLSLRGEQVALCPGSLLWVDSRPAKMPRSRPVVHSMMRARGPVRLSLPAEYSRYFYVFSRRNIHHPLTVD
jgi:hypothetical protein